MLLPACGVPFIIHCRPQRRCFLGFCSRILALALSIWTENASRHLLKNRSQDPNSRLHQKNDFKALPRALGVYRITSLNKHFSLTDVSNSVLLSYCSSYKSYSVLLLDLSWYKRLKANPKRVHVNEKIGCKWDAQADRWDE